MKNIIIISLILMSSSVFAQTGTISVTVRGLSTNKTKLIKIAVFEKEHYLRKPKYEKGVIAENDEITIQLEDVDVGMYAILAFEDNNLDGKMNVNFYGRSNELRGFSNNANAKSRPPSFYAAAFIVYDDKNTGLIINLDRQGKKEASDSNY